MKEKEENFEKAMQDLETIAQELESGKLNLDEAVEKFEKGIQISKKCSDMLEKAEKKISILINDDNELREESFIPNE